MKPLKAEGFRRFMLTLLCYFMEITFQTSLFCHKSSSEHESEVFEVNVLIIKY